MVIPQEIILKIKERKKWQPYILLSLEFLRFVYYGFIHASKKHQ